MNPLIDTLTAEQRRRFIARQHVIELERMFWRTPLWQICRLRRIEAMHARAVKRMKERRQCNSL